MSRGRPTVRIELSESQRRELEQLTKARKSAQAEATRARAVLLCAEGLHDGEVAPRVGLSSHSVGKWRRRYLEEAMTGLSDAPRSGPPRQISDEQVAELLRLTLESKPERGTHWSTRKMAAKMGLSNERVSVIWRTFGLQPHRTESFQLSTDPYFVEKVRDVVGLYLSPPQNALVLCVDEKSQCQALERSQPILPMISGRPARHSHDYFRHGTTTLFAALDVKTGEVYAQCQPRHRQEEFVGFLRHLEATIPQDLQLHVVMDNYAVHKTKAVRQWLLRHPRWHLHFIPTHSSWLNQVERFFAKITQEVIRRNSFTGLAQLKKAILDYIANHNQNPTPFRWTATADRIFEKIGGYCNKLA
jgi:transposase